MQYQAPGHKSSRNEMVTLWTFLTIELQVTLCPTKPQVKHEAPIKDQMCEGTQTQNHIAIITH